MLWFCGLADDVRIGFRGGSQSLLEKSIKQQPARAGRAAVEAEGEFIEIAIEVLGPHGALVSAEEPALEQ